MFGQLNKHTLNLKCHLNWHLYLHCQALECRSQIVHVQFARQHAHLNSKNRVLLQSVQLSSYYSATVNFFGTAKLFFFKKNPCRFHLVIFVLFMLRYITTCRKMSSLFFIYKKYKTTSIMRCLNHEWCYLMNFILKYDVAFKCEFAT